MDPIKNAFQRVKTTFYDPADGGVQVGGIIGAVVGGLCGVFLTGGSAVGLKGILSIVFLTGMGAYAGEMAGDWLEEKRRRRYYSPPAGGGPPVRQPEQGSAPEIEPPSPTPNPPDRGRDQGVG